jgi:hypothetical protein
VWGDVNEDWVLSLHEVGLDARSIAARLGVPMDDVHRVLRDKLPPENWEGEDED